MLTYENMAATMTVCRKTNSSCLRTHLISPGKYEYKKNNSPLHQSRGLSFAKNGTGFCLKRYSDAPDRLTVCAGYAIICLQVGSVSIIAGIPQICIESVFRAETERPHFRRSKAPTAEMRS